MGMGYHVNALTKDVSYWLGCIAGRGNIAAVKNRLATMGRAARGDVVDAAEQLERYFNELCAALGKEAFDIAKRIELGGEYLSDEVRAPLKAATARKPRTTITKTEAKRLAKFIVQCAKGWED